MFYYLTSSGAREGDNVVFVREPGDLFETMFFTFTNTLQTQLIKLATVLSEFVPSNEGRRMHFKEFKTIFL